MVSLVLKMQNYAVVAASNELELLAQLKQQTPDIILLDIYLDQEDGREIAKRLKENESTALIPIILYSAGNITARSITESLADCFLPKPFDLPQLFSTIKQCLPSQRGAAGP